MGLLVLSCTSARSSSAPARRAASPRGIEFIGLGFLVGPNMLSVVERPLITDFEPVIQVALGWLAFVVGLDFGRVEGRRVHPASTVLGIVCAIVTGAVVAVSVWIASERVHLAGIDKPGSGSSSRRARAPSAQRRRATRSSGRRRAGVRGALFRGSSSTSAPRTISRRSSRQAPSSRSRRPKASRSACPRSAGFGAASLALGAGLGCIVTAMLLRGAEGDAGLVGRVSSARSCSRPALRHASASAPSS